MKIIGFNFKKLEVERKETSKGKLNVNSNIDINNINEDEFSLAKDKKALRFDFEFTINYNPNVATINFEGFIVVIFEEKEAEDILKKWENKNLPDNVKTSALNYILNKCNLKSLELESEFGLPTHIPMPKVKSKKSSKKEDKGKKEKSGKSYTG